MSLLIMKNALVTIIIFLFVTGCCPCFETDQVTETGQVAETDQVNFVLFERYFDYTENFTREKLFKLSREYFIQSLVEQSELRDPSDPEATARLLFKYDVVTVDSHYESINNESGCLTVNGFGKKKVPSILSLQYALINKKWLIEDVHLERIKSSTQFSSRVMCPKEFTDK